MAKLAAVLATTHHPFYLKATTAPVEQQIPQAAEWKRKVEAYRETMTKAGRCYGHGRRRPISTVLPRQL